MLGPLPERLHASVGKALRDAWNLDSADRAARVPARPAGSLERDHPGAAASIREGLEETLTVQRLGLTALVEAEPRFRRVRGCRDVQYPVGALDALAPPDDVVADVA